MGSSTSDPCCLLLALVRAAGPKYVWGVPLTVRLDLLHDHCGGHRVDGLAVVPRLDLLGPVALRCGQRGPARLVVRPVGVMLARGKRVWVLVLRGDAVLLEKVPGARGEAAVAAHSAGDQAARHLCRCRPRSAAG